MRMLGCILIAEQALPNPASHLDYGNAYQPTIRDPEFR